MQGCWAEQAWAELSAAVRDLGLVDLVSWPSGSGLLLTGVLYPSDHQFSAIGHQGASA